MWTCPKCERQFKTKNQSHSCMETTLDDLFMNKPDDLVLAFDAIMQLVLEWEPCTVGPAKKAVVFTSKKAWLIIRPMQKVLDLKVYFDEPLEGEIFHKIQFMLGKYAHHIRIKHEDEITEELMELLQQAHQFSIH